MHAVQYPAGNGSSNPEPEKIGGSVLFVCTANICRSPMAMGLMMARLIKEQPDWLDWQVESAGTWALDGYEAARNARLVMSQRGMDISAHRARTVTADMLRAFDLVLTMEPGQKEALQVEFPDLAGRIYMLSEMAGEVSPVKDPYGQPLAAFEKTADVIDRLLSSGMARILALVGRKAG